MRVVSRSPSNMQREHERQLQDSRLGLRNPLKDGKLSAVDRSVVKLVAYKKQILWDALDALGDPDQNRTEDWQEL